MKKAEHEEPASSGRTAAQRCFGPLGVKVTDAARRLGIARATLSQIIHGKSGISYDLAIRLERAGVSTAQFWLNLQSNYQLA